MTRMARKGWLEVEKEGNTNYYWPAVAESHALEEETLFVLFRSEACEQKPGGYTLYAISNSQSTSSTRPNSERYGSATSTNSCRDCLRNSSDKVGTHYLT